MVKSFCASAGLFFVALAQAHVPEIGQIIRFQPQMMHSSKPFTVKGTAALGKAKMETSLEWTGPNQYRMVVRDVPKNFYSSGEGSSNWVLMRSGRKCALKTDAMTVNCPPAGFWGAIELSGSPNEAATALVDLGFVSESDAAYTETDARNPPKDSSAQKVHLVLGANGKFPAAALELRGPSYRGDTAGEEAPVIQYEQNFLSPLMARFSQEGELITLRALADLNVATHKTRYTHVLASRLEFIVNKTVRSNFIRQEPVYAKNILAFVLPRAPADLSSLRDELSVDGQIFLRALLLTH